jgi:hypothetical protein
MSKIIHETVQRILEPHEPCDEKERCIALHDFVRDEIRFGFTNRFERVMPEETLFLKRGHCNAQADLFCELLREAGFTARLRFVQLDKRVLKHTVPALIYHLFLPMTLFHAVTQVRLSDGSWLNTDSYIFDSKSYERQRKLLAQSNLSMGFGLCKNSTCRWDASTDAFAQASPGDLHRRNKIFSSLSAAHRAGAGNNTFLGIHFNQWLSLVPKPLMGVWHNYMNGQSN